MKQITLSRWLKFIIIGVGICGLIVYGMVIPMLGQAIAAYEQGVFDYCYWPWLIFIWVTAIPCYMVLFFAWKIPKSYRVVKGQKHYKKKKHRATRLGNERNGQAETVKLDAKQQEKVQFTTLQDITFVHTEEEI